MAGALPMLEGGMLRAPPPSRLRWAVVGNTNAGMLMAMTAAAVREIEVVMANNPCKGGDQSLPPRPNRLSRLVNRLNSETNKPTVAST